jgi:FkbM family methyltransferase
MSSPHTFKSWIRSALGSQLRRLCSWLNYELVPKLRPPRVEDFLYQTFAGADAVTYLQVGAHDGTQNDPISLFRMLPGWKGLLLEPNPQVFERLRANLAETPRHEPLNVALGDSAGTIPFYIVADPAKCKEPWWADQVSSFERAHVEHMLVRFGHAPDEASTLIRELQVSSLTFKDLLDRLHDTLDLLFIDAEGVDFRLLKTFPFARLRPRMLVFESSHLNDNELNEVLPFLTKQGYSFCAVGEDVIAVSWPS